MEEIHANIKQPAKIMKKDEKKQKICTLENYTEVCELFDAHDKLEEAYHFLLLIAFSYHSADEFRHNLHAFVQALRSVTFMLQTYKDKIPDFDNWYSKKQSEMKKNKYLKSICDSRTIVVHRHSLKPRSTIDVGLYRGRKLKLAISVHCDNPFVDSKELFDNLMPQFEQLGFIDKEHSAISEQLGIRRQWFCDELGNEEIFSTCYKAYISICEIMIEAHSFFGLELVPQGIPGSFFEQTYVLLESDLDPSLPEKWGW